MLVVPFINIIETFFFFVFDAIKFKGFIVCIRLAHSVMPNTNILKNANGFSANI